MVTSAKMTLCDTCNIWVKAQGLGTHRRQKHQILQNKTPVCAGEKSSELLTQIKEEIDGLKRLHVGSGQTTAIVEEAIEKMGRTTVGNREDGLDEKIENLNSQIGKILSRIQNIENILRF